MKVAGEMGGRGEGGERNKLQETDGIVGVSHTRMCPPLKVYHERVFYLQSY